jgi:hypothetical protein
MPSNNNTQESSAWTSRDRLSRYNERTTSSNVISGSNISDDEKELVAALGLRSYHLPGNNWCQDWSQYFANNHPIFGICCHHKKHPIGVRMRIVNLFGSIVFGLCVTNVIWLTFLYVKEDVDTAVVTISFGGGVSFGANTNNATSNATISVDLSDNLSDISDLTNINSISNNNDATSTNGQEIQITEGMIMLWTVGGALHALFDNTIWYVTACVCCLPGRSLERLGNFRWCGSYIAVFFVIAFTACATFAVVLRATLDSNEENVDLTDLGTAGINDDNIKLGKTSDASAYEFMIGYAVELVLALIVYYPLVGTILFSGVMVCGKIPVLGGRPYEVSRQKRLAQASSKEDNAWVASGHTATSTSEPSSPVAAIDDSRV